MQKNKYKPARSCLCCRRQNRSIYTGPRNGHSWEVNNTWRKYRSSFKTLALKGNVEDVVLKWEECYEGNVFMPYTD